MAGSELALQLVINAQDRTKVAFQAIAGALSGTLVGALSDFSNAAAEDEASVLRLRQAVENSGASWDANADAINARIAAGQDLAFTDDQVRESLSLLTAQTGSLDEALKRQKLAMDFARGANIPLQTASKLLGKVTDENINVFARYGIQIEKGGDATAAFAQLQAKFGGQAEVYGDSTAGAIFKIKDRIDEWKESIGASLGPAQGFLAVLPGLRDGASLLGGALGPLIGHGGKLLALLNPITLATKAWAIVQAGLNLVMSANPIALVVLALAGLAVAVKFAYDHFEGFRQVVDAVLGFLGRLLAPLSFVADALGALGKAVGLVGDDTKKMKTDVSADFAGMSKEATASTSTMKANVTGSATAMKDTVVTVFDQMKAAGVGNTQAMETDAILAALGMSEGIRTAVADMVTGVTGKSAEQREALIYDMQIAKLQASQRAAGMSEEVIAAIDKMVYDSHQSTLRMKTQHAESFDAMKAKQAELAGETPKVSAATEEWEKRSKLALDAAETANRENLSSMITRVHGLRDAVNELRDKTITITTNYRTSGGGSDVIAAASGFEGEVTGPQLFLAGEAGTEHVSIRPASQARGQAPGGGFSIGQIVINGNVDSSDRVRELGLEFARQYRLAGGAA